MRSAIVAFIIVSLTFGFVPLTAAHAQGANTPPASTPPASRNTEIGQLLNEAWKAERGANPLGAEAIYKGAIAKAEKIDAPAERAELGRAWLWLGWFYTRHGRQAEAFDAGEKALKVYEERLPPTDPTIVTTHGTIGIFANRNRDYAKAEQHLRWAIDAYERDPAHTSATEASTDYLNLSTAMRGLHRLPEAEAALRRAIEIREKTDPRDNRLVAFAWRWLADFLNDEKRPAEAEAAWASAIAAAEQAPSTQDTLPSLLNAQAMFLLRTGKKFDAARAAAQRALEVSDKTLGPDHALVGGAHLVLGHIANESHDQPTAAWEYIAALDHYNRKPNKAEAMFAAAAAYQLALSYRVAKRPAQAESMMRAAIAIRQAEAPNDTADLAAYWRVLALALSDQEKYAESEVAFRKTIELYRKAGKANSADDASVHLWLGDVLFRAGLYPQAAEVEQQARAIFTELGDPLKVAEAQVRLGTAYRYLWRGREAEALDRAALAVRQEKLQPDDPLIGEAMRELAAALRWQGKHAEAEPLYRQALAIREKAYGPNSQAVLADRFGLALAIEGMGRVTEAEGLLRQLLTDRERALGLDHPDVAETLVSLVWNLRRQGRFAEAAPLAERPLEIDRKRFGPDHPGIVGALLALALVHQDRSEYDEADRLFRNALRIRIQVYGDQSPNVAESYGDLLRLAMARRQFEEAAAFAGRRLAIIEARLGANSPALVGPLLDLQTLKGLTGDLDTVDQLAKRILAIAEAAYGADSVPVAMASMNLAEAYRLRNKLGNVELYYERPVAIIESKLGPEHPLLAEALRLLASAHVLLGRPKEALEAHDRALAILAGRFGEDSPVLSTSLNDKALILLQLGRLDEAERLLRRSAELLRKGAGKPTAALGIVLGNLSLALRARGKESEADTLRAERLDIFTRLYGADRLPPLVPAPLLPPAQREI